MSPGSARLLLDHYFNNRVGSARNSYIGQGDLNRDFDLLQKNFISALEEGIRLNLLSDKGIGVDELKEMIEIGRRDWKDVNTIKDLYKKYYELTGKQYDEKEFFPGL